MLDTLSTTLNAILPIILLILLGYLLKKFKFINDNFVKIGNKFVFKICLPCMLFVNIYDQLTSFTAINWTVVLYSVIIVLVLFAIGLLTCILTTKDFRRRGVILQCTFRSNFAIIGLALVERLGGDTAIAGIVSAFTIPVFNILAVIALYVFVGDKQGSAELPDNTPSGGVSTVDSLAANSEATALMQASEAAAIVKKPASKHSVKGILLNIVKNPLIIGVVLGLLFVGIRDIEALACNCSSAEVPFRFDTQLKFLHTIASNLKSVASPLALVVMGGQFEFSAVKGMTKEIVVATVWRVILAPLLGIGIAILLNAYTSIKFGSEVYPMFVALFGTPVAVSSAIMAGEMGNDEQLATQLVVWTSIASAVTISLTVFLLMTFGVM